MPDSTETTENWDVIIIGAGVMGLAAAYHASKTGAKVLVLEAGPVAGGMAAHFDFEGVSLERYYHFMCLTDNDTFDLMNELNIGDQIAWKNTKMGYQKDGKLYPWGNPFALLAYPHLNIIEKFRYGLMAWWCTKRQSWGNAENMTAPDWFRAWLGQSCYDKMWRRLLEQKFFQFTETVSATWLATRIQRIGRSRESLMKEKLGHIVGGTQTLVDALLAAISANGGEVRCEHIVKNATHDAGTKSTTLTCVNGKTFTAPKIISTAPTPIAADIFTDLSQPEREQLSAIDNIGVVCLVYKLKRAVSQNFWVNIMDDQHAVPGLIEFSNLRDFGDDHIVYAPYYMPIDNERWAWSDEALLDEAFKAIQAVNPEITPNDVTARMASRLKYSQPICTPNFLESLPAIQTSIPGVQIADTCYYYPEDRGVSESVGLGKRLAAQAVAP